MFLASGFRNATAIADARGARMRHLDETGVYCHVIADGGMTILPADIAKAFVCGADAVMIGAPLAAAHEAPGRGYHWGMATSADSHLASRVPVSALQPKGTLQEIFSGPAHDDAGADQLVWGVDVRRWQPRATESLKDFQKAELIVSNQQRSNCMTELAEDVDTILVVDFGAQYAQLIARRVREARVYSEIVPHTITAKRSWPRSPKGIILSGGPASVHVEDAPLLNADIYNSEVPIFGICYGAQLIAQQMGGTVANTGKGEYGRTGLEITNGGGLISRHAQRIQRLDEPLRLYCASLPEGFIASAKTDSIPVAALENDDRRIHGVQFHPEVVHTEWGQDILKRFLFDVCECRPTWTMTIGN